MRRWRLFRHNLFDVRRGERGRTIFMSLYLLFVMFAYYIVKAVSRAMFLTEFKVDKLPYLNMLIAAGGGMLAYLYSKLALQTSLKAAVTRAMAISAACLAAFWWLVAMDLPWMLYVFNVWVSLFSIVLVSQGWLVAANLFDARTAKRVYGILGLGLVLGAAFGGTFTAFTARLIGSRNLLLASIGMLALAYSCFLLALVQKGVSLAGARTGKAGGEQFRFADIFVAIRRHRHLQVIVGIITLTYIVGTLVEFQFQKMASETFRDRDQLAAFFGRFQGIYVNAASILLQFLLTAAVVRRLGVGGTLQIMPAALTAASLAAIAAPGLGTAMCTELTESATRYTVNRTGMELLYLPLPVDLRNRTKSFVDIFTDRMGRGVGGALLAILIAAGLGSMREIAGVAVALCAIWIGLAYRAKGEYLKTVRRRLATRRLDLDESRVRIDDPSTVRLLEEAARSPHSRQACYALSLLAQTRGYDLTPLLAGLSTGPVAEVRGRVYELARDAGVRGLENAALAELAENRSERSGPALRAAAGYLLAFASEPVALARELLARPDPEIAAGVLDALTEHQDWWPQLITREFLASNKVSPDPARRALAARAVGIVGDRGTGALHELLADRDPEVVAAAFSAAGAVRNRAYVDAIVRRLADAHLRAAAIDALTAYGTGITGLLSDILEDPGVAIAIRRQIPRVLKRVPDQRAVDVLMRLLDDEDAGLRAGVLKALSALRDRAPGLQFGQTFVTRHVLNEARRFFELLSALAPLRPQEHLHPATRLLTRSLEDRARQTIQRLFRLLGLRYPPGEIRAAYLALNRSRGQRDERMVTALEFLENVLDPPLRPAVLAVLDPSSRSVEIGRDLFGLEQPDAESALRELMRSGDSWLAACAVAAAAEQNLQSLAPQILLLGGNAGPELAEVSKAALARLSARATRI